MIRSSVRVQSNTAAGAITMMVDPDEKIMHDLSTLSDQILLCQSMLSATTTASSSTPDEALLTVIG
jgi:hypothetical protein